MTPRGEPHAPIGVLAPQDPTTPANTPALIPQQHGGKLLAGGVRGGKGGRPPGRFRKMMAALASSEEAVAGLKTILADPKHPAYVRALEFCAARGYGVIPRDSGEGSGGGGPLVVLIRQELPRRAYEVGTSAPGLLGAGGGGGSDGDH